MRKYGRGINTEINYVRDYPTNKVTLGDNTI